MSPTKTKNSREQRHENEVFEARDAYEQELLVGMTIDLVTALANAAEITQRELADRLGVTEGRVSQILSGKENLSLKKLASLGWALGVQFRLIPTAIENRDETPAAGDPPPPPWVDRLQTASD
jgi:antitoxin component HigA of HigAB toxin-antitoxin module